MSLSYVDSGFREDLLKISISVDDGVKVHEICLRLLQETAKILKMNINVGGYIDGWVVINELIKLSREYVLARFYAENISLGLKAPVDDLVRDMMIRDSVTCMEKIRAIVLSLVKT